MCTDGWAGTRGLARQTPSGAGPHRLGRLALVVALVSVQPGLATAADLSPERAAPSPSIEDGARLVPFCEANDEPLVLACGPSVPLPSLDGSLGRRIVSVTPVRRKPYRQVFGWGD